MSEPSKIQATHAEIDLLTHARDLCAKWADYELAGALVSVIKRCETRQNDDEVRCMECGECFSLALIVDAKRCPSCKSESMPCHPHFDVYLRMNWQELRIIAQFASNYAEGLKDQQRSLLAKILTRINHHRPQGAGALTLVMAVKELQRTVPSATLINAEGNVIIPPREEPADGGAS